MASLANLLGRILLAQLFMQAGLNKIFSYDGTIAYMATQHVSAMLLPLVIALETGGALALLLGWHVRLFAFLLAGFSLLAALVFLSAMVRALWLPETSNGCQLCEAGICTFLLCFCWELPRVLVLLFHGITAADLPEVLFGFGMCCIGALGLFTVARVAGSDGRPAIPRHAVG